MILLWLALVQDNPAATAKPREEKWMKKHDELVALAKKGDVDVLFLGDSITEGWKYHGKKLWEKEYAPRKAANFGISGDSTQHVLWRLRNGELDGITPRAVVLMIGTNNMGSHSADQIAGGVEAIVKELRAKLPKVKILLLAIFPRGEKPGEIREKIAKTNEKIRNLGDVWIDLTERFVGDGGVISKDVMPDFLHLSAKGYEIWADGIRDGLADLVQEWTRVDSPNDGSKTGALWFDDAKIGYLGRGESADGGGLYRTKDGGATWEAMPEFQRIRVNDVRRGPDGRLYVAGWNMDTNGTVWVVDEKDFKPKELLRAGNDVWTRVGQAETIAIADDGQAMVDSLTGVTFAYRAAGGDFVEGRTFMEESLGNPDAAGWQVRRIVSFGNRFYACGSLINEPAMVFLPSKNPKATFHFTRLELQSANEDGELMDMHVWSGERAIVAGICQTTKAPLAYLGTGDLYKKESWKRIDFGVSYRAWIRKIAVSGDTIVAVGDKVPTAQGGFILKSADGGKTWKDITPASKVGAFSNVWRFENGSMIVAASGELWILK